MPEQRNRFMCYNYFMRKVKIYMFFAVVIIGSIFYYFNTFKCLITIIINNRGQWCYDTSPGTIVEPRVNINKLLPY